MTRRTHRAAIAGLAVATVVLTAIVTRGTLAWIGTTFPGFFVMANRVVPSIALSDWQTGDPDRLFQHEVLAVDGVAVGSGEAIYAAVRPKAPGESVRYTVRAVDGSISTHDVEARRFSLKDYVLLFAAFLMNGAAFLAIGLFVAVTKPRSPASAGFLSTTFLISIFAITACDLYGPARFFRLHVAAEALLAAGCVHLTLVFPTDRLHGRRRAVLAVVYLLFGGFAVVYEMALATPVAYTTAHLAASVTHGIAALTFSAALVHDLMRSPSPLVRRRVAVVGLGALGGYVIPGVLMAVSAMRGGQVPLNASAFTAVLFPASVAYAIIKQDLFEIDVMLRRTATYAITLFAVAVLYFVALSMIGAVIPAAVLSTSPVLGAALNLAILFFIAPVKRRVQDTVDSLFFRQGYDPESSLSELGHALAGIQRLPEVLRHTGDVLARTVTPLSTSIMLTSDGAHFRDAGGAGLSILLEPEIASRLTRGRILTRYEWEDATDRAAPCMWKELGAQIVVPIRSGDALIGIMALASKASGRSYTEHDRRYLAAAAAAIALAVTNARAFEQVAELNATLEQQVRDRTAALQTANVGLNRSYEELRLAYEKLERNHASLIRADRLVTLGRLTAGIAHEVNSPLGAVQNTLKVLGELAREYSESLDDPNVTTADHQQIAQDMIANTRAAITWAQKASEFISRVKLHGRESRSSDNRPFQVAPLMEEIATLLAHRLRAVCCELRYTEEPDGITMAGDPGRLGQVMVNLVGNALDAYEDAGCPDGRIDVCARQVGDVVTISIRDWAGGIPEHVLPRIFDELYTTKEPGRGTGLGLWICRNLVEESFAGTLTVETEEGKGSVFVITVAAARERGAFVNEVELSSSGTHGFMHPGRGGVEGKP
jgi:signal transduction histidine kinase